MHRRAPLICLGLATATLVPSATAHALTVYAATSLARVLPQVDGDPAYSFGGSDTLQLQIQRGAPADLFLSASPQEPRALHRAGRCSPPVAFTSNSLALVVRQGNPKQIGSVFALRRGGLKLAVGNPAVPIGDYTRRLLRSLGLTSVLRVNRVSQAANVGQVVTQVAFGGADAGFVYRSDALAQLARLDIVRLPRAAQPAIRYEGCVVQRRGADARGARALFARLKGARARGILRRAGFGPAPR